MRLAGVVVDVNRGVDATSDGDLVAHAVADALLAAGGKGDLGMHFPSEDPRLVGADSMDLLGQVVEMCSHVTVTFLDVTVIAQELRIAPHRSAMQENLARVLRVGSSAVSVKATTTDRMGSIGSGDGLAAAAVVTAEVAATPVTDH